MEEDQLCMIRGEGAGVGVGGGVGGGGGGGQGGGTAGQMGDVSQAAGGRRRI